MEQACSLELGYQWKAEVQRPCHSLSSDKATPSSHPGLLVFAQLAVWVPTGCVCSVCDDLDYTSAGSRKLSFLHSPSSWLHQPGPRPKAQTWLNAGPSYVASSLP